jgi:LmbE family N-acetylglucosaminyl deacetylase
MHPTPFNKNVVAFAAHPDDTEIFTAGTLALLAGAGWKLTICTVSGGGMGGIGSDEASTIRIRQAEARQAAAVIGADYVCLDGRDGYLYDTAELRIAALALIRQKRAGLVITHLPNDYHADHRATCAIIEAAAMQATLPNCPTPEPPLERTPVLYHSSPLGQCDSLGNSITLPHFFVDIGQVVEKKTRMLACHKSQIELMRVMHRMDDFFGEMQKQDRLWGKEADCEFAEAWWQHLGGGYPKDELLQSELADFIKIPFSGGSDREP